MEKKDLLLFNLDYVKQIPGTNQSKEKYRFYLVRQRRSGENEFKQLEFEYDDPELLELINILLEKLKIRLKRYEDMVEAHAEKKEIRENIINKLGLGFNITLFNILLLSIFFNFLNHIPFEIAEGIGTIGTIINMELASLGAAYVSPFLTDFINSCSHYSKEEFAFEEVKQKIELLQSLQRHLTEENVPEPFNILEQGDYTKVFDRGLAEKIERVLTEMFVRNPKDVRTYQILERLNNKKLELVHSKIGDLTLDLEDTPEDIRRSSDGTILSLKKGNVKNVYFERLATIKERSDEATANYDAARENVSIQRNTLVAQIAIDFDRAKRIEEETGCSYLNSLIESMKEQEKEVLGKDPKYRKLVRICRTNQTLAEAASSELSEYCEYEIEILKRIRAEIEEYLLLCSRIARLQKKQGRLEDFFVRYEPIFNEALKKK